MRTSDAELLLAVAMAAGAVLGALLADRAGLLLGAGAACAAVTAWVAPRIRADE
jgi:uncharacterized membrane protein YgaE (UPF0421/DUF939 family)